MGTPGIKTAYQGRSKQILIRLADDGSLRTTDLADMFGVKTQGVSGYLKKLREEEFVNSVKGGGSDKRFVYHTLTLKGREYLDSLQESGPDRELKFYDPEKPAHEFQKAERGADDIKFADWKGDKEAEEKRSKDLLKQAEAMKKAEEERKIKESLAINENVDGVLSF